MEYSKDLSIVISLYNEEESLRELVRWIHSVLDGKGLKFEIIMTDDGSSDNSWTVIRELAEKDKGVTRWRGNPSVI